MGKDSRSGLKNIDSTTQANQGLPYFNFTLKQREAARNMVLAVKKFVDNNGWKAKQIIDLPEYHAWLNAIRGQSTVDLCNWQDTTADDQDLQLDLLNMTDDQVHDLSRFGVNVINKIRNDLGISDLVGKVLTSSGMVSAVQEISKLGMQNPNNRLGYDIYALKKAAYDHGMASADATDADKKITSTNSYGESLMIVGNNHLTPKTNMAEAKQQVINAIIGLIINGKSNGIGHTEAIIGVLSLLKDSFGDDNEYVGTTISFKKLKYNSTSYPSYLIHILQYELWQIANNDTPEEVAKQEKVGLTRPYSATLTAGEGKKHSSKSQDNTEQESSIIIDDVTISQGATVLATPTVQVPAQATAQWDNLTKVKDDAGNVGDYAEDILLTFKDGSTKLVKGKVTLHVIKAAPVPYKPTPKSMEAVQAANAKMTVANKHNSFGTLLTEIVTAIAYLLGLKSYD